MSSEESPRTRAGAITTGRVETNCTANTELRQPRRPLHLRVKSGSYADAFLLGFTRGAQDALREVWRLCPESRTAVETLASKYQEPR